MIDLRSDTLAQRAPARASWRGRNMLSKMKIPRVTFLFMVALMGLIFSAPCQGQRRSRLKAPKALLDLIDKDDRDCVLQTGLQKSVSVTPIQLAHDGTRQILIKGAGVCLCGAQNCPFWIYRKSGNDYELLLTGTGSTRVRAGRRSAKRYRDVISQSHASAAETIIRTYRYDGARYQLTHCVNRAYYDDNGTYTKRPTYRSCGGENSTETYVTLPADLRDLELPTIDKRTLKLSDYSGRTVVVSLIASWCFPCLQTLSEFDKISRSYSPGVQLIGVATTVGDPQVEALRRMIANRDLKMPIVWENGGFSQSLSKLANAPETLPQTFVLDAHGQIRRQFNGYNPANTPTLFRMALDEIKAEENRKPGR